MICCDSLCFNFNEHKVLENIRLKCQKSEIVCIMGASGSGKSTLLNLINGVLKPIIGCIHLEGTSACIFQDKRLIPWLNIFSNIVFGAKSIGIQKNISEVYEILDTVGLPREIIFEYPKILSGGMEQRVGIARALICDPDILLMDEPFSALDHTTKNDIIKRLIRFWDQKKCTLLFVTHDFYEACALANKIYYLNNQSLNLILELDIPPNERDEYFIDTQARDLKKELAY